MSLNCYKPAGTRVYLSFYIGLIATYGIFTAVRHAVYQTDLPATSFPALSATSTSPTSTTTTTTSTTNRTTVKWFLSKSRYNALYHDVTMPRAEFLARGKALVQAEQNETVPFNDDV